MLIKYASGPTSHPQYSPYTYIFLVCCYCCNPSLGLWHGSYSEVLVARRMPANITGKHPKLRRRRKDQKMPQGKSPSITNGMQQVVKKCIPLISTGNPFLALAIALDKVIIWKVLNRFKTCRGRVFLWPVVIRLEGQATPGIEASLCGLRDGSL